MPDLERENQRELERFGHHITMRVTDQETINQFIKSFKGYDRLYGFMHQEYNGTWALSWTQVRSMTKGRYYEVFTELRNIESEPGNAFDTQEWYFTMDDLYKKTANSVDRFYRLAQRLIKERKSYWAEATPLQRENFWVSMKYWQQRNNN